MSTGEIPGRRFVSVGTKLAIATAVVIALVTAGLYGQLTRREKSSLIAAKSVAARMVADLFAASTSAPLEFDDAQAESEELRQLTTNRQIVYAAIWRDGHEKPEHETGFEKGESDPGLRAGDDTRVVERPDRIMVIEPVRNSLGARMGQVVVSFSLAAEDAAFAASRTRILLMSVVLAAGLLLVLGAISRRTIVVPLDRLVAAAGRLEGGGTAVVPVVANDEVGRLADAFNRMAAAIHDREQSIKTALAALEAKDAIISADLRKARRFQQTLLPRQPAEGRLRFVTVYRPAELVGGDIYDIFELGPDAYRIFLADTTGHGVQASLRTMVLRTEYDSIKRASSGPAEALVRLNEKLTASFPDLELRCSAVCIDVLPEKDGSFRLVYANAGHPPFVHATAHGANEVYERGPFLGVFESISLTPREVRLERGDRVLVFTDALYEQEAPDGTSIGDEPAARAILDLDTKLDRVVDRIVSQVAEFARKPDLDDDLTLIAFECLPEHSRKQGTTTEEAHATR